MDVSVDETGKDSKRSGIQVAHSGWSIRVRSNAGNTAVANLNHRWARAIGQHHPLASDG
jgi:hypothetical protein